MTKLMGVCLSFESDVASIIAAIEKYNEIASVDACGHNVLHHCMLAGWREDDYEIIQALLDRGADPEATTTDREELPYCPQLEAVGWTPLMESAWNGSSLQMKALVDWGVEIDKRDTEGRTALMIAASQEFETLSKIKMLLKAGASKSITDNHGMTAWDNAREYHDFKAGGDISSKHQTFHQQWSKVLKALEQK